MKRRWLLNLALLLVVIGLGLAVVLRPQPSAQGKFKLSTLNAAEINSIQLSRPGQPTLKLEKQGSAWKMVAPFTARADAVKAQRLLDLLQVSADQRFPASDLIRFGLDQPLATLSLNQQSFSFGTENPLTGEIYIATEGQVYLIASRYLADALKSPADFISKRLFAEDEVPLGFDLGQTRFIQEQGKWRVEPPNPTLSQDQLNQWAEEWRWASSLLVLPSAAGKAEGEIRLSLRNGKSVELKILQMEPDFVLQRSDENLEYHFLPATGLRLLNPATPAKPSAKN
jgi:hypothetical protein